MKTHLDWSAYKESGTGDPYADIPKTGGDFAKAVAVCIGSGVCERENKGVMCPSYKITGNSHYSTGGRVKLLKAALNGKLGALPFADASLAEAMDLCVSCKGCKRECENEVDMALIKAEYLAQRQQQIKPPLRNVLWAALPRLLNQHWLVKPLVSMRNSNRVIAQLLEKTLAISAKHALPIPAEKPFSQAVIEKPLTAQHSEKPPIVLFVDTFNNYFNPEVAQAAVNVLQAAGYSVKIATPTPETSESDRPLCCGRTYFSNGMIDKARHEAQRLLNALMPDVQAGALIIGLEPSCILSLRDEYLTLGLGSNAEKLANNILLLEEFIAKEHTSKRWQLNFKALAHNEKVLVHGHCHQKAVGAMKAMRKVLRLIPQLDFEILDTSCCGMAGHFGYEAEHYQASQQMAELALYPALRSQANATVLANGFSCQQQIKHGDTQQQPLHIAQLLAAAMDLNAITDVEA